MSKLSEKLVEIRTMNNLTQDQFADQLFVTRQAVSKWERDICYPDIEILKIIATKYNISLNVLLDIAKKDKNQEIKNLAEKSYTSIVIGVFGWLLCIFLAILSFGFAYSGNDTSYLVYGFVATIGVIFESIYLPITMKTPRNLIKYNDFGIFIYKASKKQIFIKYEDIVVVKARNARAGRSTINYSFGKIMIETKNRYYTVREVKQVDNVKSRIIELKVQNTYSEI